MDYQLINDNTNCYYRILDNDENTIILLIDKTKYLYTAVDSKLFFWCRTNCENDTMPHKDDLKLISQLDTLFKKACLNGTALRIEEDNITYGDNCDKDLVKTVLEMLA